MSDSAYLIPCNEYSPIMIKCNISIMNTGGLVATIMKASQ